MRQTFYDLVRERSLQSVKGNSNAGETDVLKQNAASMIKLARTSEELSENIINLSDGAFNKLIDKIGKLNINSGKTGTIIESLVKEIAELYKGDEKYLKLIKEIAAQKIKERSALLKELEEQKKAAQQRMSILEDQRKYHSAQIQDQREALENFEKNFWSPFTGLFKGSHAVAFAKEYTNAFNQATGNIIKSSATLARSAFNSYINIIDGVLGAAVANAGIEFTKKTWESFKELGKGTKEGFKEGKEGYFRRQQEKLTKIQEKTVGKLDHEISHFQNSIDKFESSIRLHRQEAFAVSNKQKNVSEKLMDVFVKSDKNADKHSKNLDKESKVLNNIGSHGGASRLGGIASGIAGGLARAIPVVSGVFSGMMDSMSEIASLASGKLTEIKKEQHDFKTGLAQSLGNVSDRKVQDLIGLENIGGKGIRIEQIKEGFEGLAHELGNINFLTNKQIGYQIDLNKLYGFSGEEGAKFSKTLEHTHIELGKSFEKFRKQVVGFASKEGVSSKLVMKDIASNTNWIALVGSKKMTENFAKSSAEIRSMGLHMETMVKAMDSFDNFEQATENTFKLNAALGTSFDPVQMHILAMQGDVSTIQKQIMDNIGLLRNELNPMQVKAISQTLGMTFEEVRELEKGSKIRREMAGFTTTQSSAIEKMMRSEAAMNVFRKNGFTDDVKQKEFMTGKLRDVYAKHRTEYGNDFNRFLSDFNNQELGLKLQKEFELSLKETEVYDSMEKSLSRLVTIQDTEEHNARENVKKSAEGIQKLIEFQTIANQLMTNLLVWSIQTLTPMASGLLAKAGFKESAKAVNSIGYGIADLMSSQMASSKENAANLGIIDRDQMRTIEKEITGANIFTVIGNLMGFNDKFQSNIGEKLEESLRKANREYELNDKKLKAMNLEFEKNPKVNKDFLQAQADLTKAMTLQVREIENQTALKALLDNEDISGLLDGLKTNFGGNPLNRMWKMQELQSKIGGFFSSHTNFNDEQKRYIYEYLYKNKLVGNGMEIANLFPSSSYIAKKDGGYIRGAGGPRDDRILARLSNGEYVNDAETVRKWGVPFFESLKGFKTGGFVDPDYQQYQSEQKAKAQILEKRKKLGYGKTLSDMEIMMGASGSNLASDAIAKSTSIGAQLVTSPLAYLYGKISSIANVGAHGMDLLPHSKYGIMAMKAMHGISGDKDINSFADIVNYPLTLLKKFTGAKATGTEGITNLASVIGNIKGGEEFIGSSVHSALKGTGNIIGGGVGNAIKSSHAVSHATGAGAFTAIKQLSETGHLDLPWLLASILTGGVAGKFPIAGKAALPLEQTVHAMFGHHEEKHGSFRGGMMPNASFPGYINTNDYDSISVHKNERMSVSTQEQSVKRDTLLESSVMSNETLREAVTQLVSAIRESKTPVIFMLDGKVIDERILNTVSSKVLSS